MKVKITNMKPTSGELALPVHGPGLTRVGPGVQKEIAGLTRVQAQEALGLVDVTPGQQVLVTVEVEAKDEPILKVDLKNPSDPAGGAGTCAACGFDLEDLYGNSVSKAIKGYFAAFADADCKTLHGTATLDTAAAGTIDSGAGTNMLKVTASATGELSVTLTNSADDAVYMKFFPLKDEKQQMDCSEVDLVTFTA